MHSYLRGKYLTSKCNPQLGRWIGLTNQSFAGCRPTDAVFMQSVFSDDVIEIDPPAINNCKFDY